MIRTNLFVVLCFLFPTFSSIAQVQEKHPDSYYANTHITGIGTNSIVYHLDNPIDSKILQACSDYIAGYKHVVKFEITSTAINMLFAEPVSNEQIYLFIQRLEMNFLNRQRKSS
jgi:hypothetical protein